MLLLVCRAIVCLTLVESFYLLNICQSLSKKEKNISKNTGQSGRRNPSLCHYLELFPQFVQSLTGTAKLKEKDILKLLLKKKALSDSKGLNGTSVFYFLPKLLVWGGAGNLWL